MLMTSGLRKLALTAHITSSVGWIGAVACFLALAVVGLAGRDAGTVQAAYVAMNMATWFVIVPASLAALLSGIIQSLGTRWGLFRHHWVVAKLLLTILATIVLLQHTQPIGVLAVAAAKATVGAAELHGVRVQMVVDASAALLVLLLTTTLGVYKPRGTTRYGWRKQQEESGAGMAS